jgi:Mrp family chromosome partitioning ATPase
MAECTHDCSSCGENCGERKEIQKLSVNKHSKVRKVIGVVSGKGGVGKSSVTSMLATAARRQGLKVAILDADITGPSIPKAFGATETPKGNAENEIYPVVTKTGIEIMSTNLLLQNDTDPVLWRGPILGGAIQQFWTDVVWGDIDVMFVDMPPGTGDVALTVYQQLPVDGIVIVTSPQQLVEMIVEKAVNMADMMNIPVL